MASLATTPRWWSSSLRNPSWLYPFKGLYYFTRRRSFWPLLGGRLLPLFFLSLFIFSTLFIWTYLPQLAFLAIFHGRLAWLNATFLVLGEGAAIVALLFEAFFVDETLVDVFDAVLVNEGCEELVASQRNIFADEGQSVIKRLGRPQESAIYSPFSLRQIVEFIVFLPFNLVPVVGTIVFLFMTGYRAGPFHHWRYFKLLRYTKNQRKEAIKRRQLKYTWFGTAVLLLQLVPMLSMAFLLTTAAGSALWVADLEKQKTALQPTAMPDEEYTDDPV